MNEGDVVVSRGPRLFARRVAQNFFHIEGSGLLRESAIEPHEPDRLFQFPEVLVDVRAGQNSMHFVVLDQDAGPFAAGVSPALPKPIVKCFTLSSTASATSSGIKILAIKYPRWRAGHLGGAVRLARYGA